MPLTDYQRRVCRLLAAERVAQGESYVAAIWALVWATCGKDPGLSPLFILEQASRSTHYTKEDYETLAFEGIAPDATELRDVWRSMLREAPEMIAILPEDQIGKCVTTRDGNIFFGTATELKASLQSNDICFHAGCIRGAWPSISV